MKELMWCFLGNLFPYKRVGEWCIWNMLSRVMIWRKRITQTGEKPNLEENLFPGCCLVVNDYWLVNQFLVLACQTVCLRKQSVTCFGIQTLGSLFLEGKSRSTMHTQLYFRIISVCMSVCVILWTTKENTTSESQWNTFCLLH